MAPTGKIVVGMTDLYVFEQAVHYNCLGLGSCIGLVALDCLTGISGMVHIMLPEAFKDRTVEKPGKFADRGIKELLHCMTNLGADSRKLAVAYAGGAQVFKFGNTGESRMDVGARNCEAVAKALESAGIRPVAVDVGGSSGRTVAVDTATGIVKIRTVASGEKVLCNLKETKGTVAA